MSAGNSDQTNYVYVFLFPDLRTLLSQLCLRIPPPPTRVKIPKIGKRRFYGQKTPISQRPRKGRFESNKNLSVQGTTRITGIFGLKAPFSGALGNGSFLTLKPSFPDFGALTPVGGGGGRNSQTQLVPNWEPTKNMHFHTLELYPKPYLDTTW